LDAGKLIVGNNVVVVGAGNTAIDCATMPTAGCAGCHHGLPARRKRDDRVRTRIRFRQREGVNFSFLTQPVRVISENRRVTAVPVCTNEARAGRSSGRPSPQPVAGSEFFLAADQVVKAIGQQKPSLASQLKLKPKKDLSK